MRVTILDQTDNWEQDAVLADDIALRAVMVELLKALGMPDRDPTGEKVTYGICVEGQSHLLDPDRSLRDNGVLEGMRLRLVAAFSIYSGR